MANAEPTTSDTPLGLVLALIHQLRQELRIELLAEIHAHQQTTSWPEWVSVETAARYLDISAERVRKLQARRAVAFYQERRGCRVLFRRTDLDQWMSTHRNEPRGNVG